MKLKLDNLPVQPAPPEEGDGVESADDFAREDGFIDYEAMVLFFKKLYPKKEWPITLHLTEWNPLP